MSGLFRTQPAQTLARGVNIQSSVYGKPIPMVYGTTKVAGNVFIYGNFQTISVTSGGGGKGSMFNSGTTQYQYVAAFALAVSEGPIFGYGQAWRGQEVHPNIAGVFFGGFLGTYPQTPWAVSVTWDAFDANGNTISGPVTPIGYNGIAYVASGAYNMGTSAALPNLQFEVAGLLAGFVGADIDPSLVLKDFLTNPHYGLGFPASRIGDLTQWSNYCLANDLIISPAYDSQRTASDMIDELMTATNSAVFFSNGQLQVTPYGDVSATGNGKTFTPNLTPLFSLGDDDYMRTPQNNVGASASAGSAGPVLMTRKRKSDRINSFKVEYLDRSNNYNPAIAYAENQAEIDSYGKRTNGSKQLHLFCKADAANLSAQLQLRRELINNTYRFDLDQRYILLDVMDVIEISDSNLGLSNQLVRIIEIDENDDGTLSFVCEDLLIGTGGSPVYSFAQQQGQPLINIGAPPGATNTPVFFEPPFVLNSDLEVWIGVSGQSNWGGADVWISTDGVNYALANRITGGARMGVLTAPLPTVVQAASGETIDQTNTLSIDLTESQGTLDTASAQQAQNLSSLCYVDGELLAYATATLTGTNKYNLTYLVRGAYGTEGLSTPTTFDPTNTGSLITISGGNLIATNSSVNTDINSRATTAESSGKFYAEFAFTVTGTDDQACGIGNASFAWTSNPFLGIDTNGIGFYGATGVYFNGVNILNWNNGGFNGDTVQMAVDLDHKRIWWAVNGGVWNNSSSANPAANIGGIDISSIIGTGNVWAGITEFAVNDKITANFGASAYSFTPPAGFGNWGGAIAHPTGSNFIRLDTQGLFKYPFTQDRVGQTIYVKFLAFNPFGGGQISLANATPYSYVIQGTALNVAPEQITNLAEVFVGNLAQLTWTEVTDFRTIFYEIRSGTSWNNGQLLARQAHPPFNVMGDGTYWVSSFANTAQGGIVYGENALGITVVGTNVSANIFATREEDPTWSGTLSGAVVKVGNNLQSNGLGGGTYTIPTGDRISITYPFACAVIMKWTSIGQPLNSSIFTYQGGATTTTGSATVTGLIISSTTAQFNGGSTVTGFATTAGFQPGQPIVSTALPSLTEVLTIESSVAITVSQNALTGSTASPSTAAVSVYPAIQVGEVIQSVSTSVIPVGVTIIAVSTTFSSITMSTTALGASTTSGFSSGFSGGFGGSNFFYISIDFTQTPDLFGAADVANTAVFPYIRTSQDGGNTFSNWQKWVAGYYRGNVFDAQLQIQTNDINSVAVVEAFSFSVDVPDRVDHYTNFAVSSLGSTLVFRPDDNQLGSSGSSAAFNGGQNKSTAVTVLAAASSGVDINVVPSAITLSQCVLNAFTSTGGAIACSANIVVEGY